jgi:hypothetical protein
MSAADDIIRDVFGDDESGLDENPVSLRAEVHFTDPFFGSLKETRKEMEDALRNSFDNVVVTSIEGVVDEELLPSEEQLPSLDPATGIWHYPGMED